MADLPSKARAVIIGGGVGGCSVASPDQVGLDRRCST